MRLTFVGTGASCGVPVIGHLNTNCACRDAIENPNGPNRRNNVALLISLPFPDTSVVDGEAAPASAEVQWHHVLIDCGKTFRNAYLRVLAPMRVRAVDALLLTHGHADAMHCVEELCGMQTEAARDMIRTAASPVSNEVSRETWEGEENVDEMPRTLRRIPTYLTYPTLEQIEMVSRDLARSSFHIGQAPSSHEAFAQAMRETENAVSSFASETSVFNAPATVMDLFFLDEERPKRIYVPIGPLVSQKSFALRKTDSSAEYVSPPVPNVDAELPFYSFPVEHGPRYTSMCFAFGRGTALKSRLRDKVAPPKGSCVVYISDVSAIPATSMAFLLDLVKIDVLVLDLLAEHGAPSASHYCADEAIPMVMQLAPRKAYFVGMFCSLEHHSTNAQLAEELADLREKVRKELAAFELAEASSPLDATIWAQKRRFVEETVSMELAYDGQQLNFDP